MSNRHLIPDVWFDEQATRAMGEAFDQACGALGILGVAVTLREIIAQRIVEAAKAGERDPAVLCRKALNAPDIGKSARQLAA